MKWFGREPALYLTAALALVQLVAVQLHLTEAVQDSLSVIVTAAYAVALAAVTRPWQPSIITGGIATILTALGAFGIDISPDWISGLNAVVAAVFALALTNRVSPAPGIDPRVSGAR